MLVPAATSIGMRCSSSHLITPTCAMPRALPPPNATPTAVRPVEFVRTGRTSAGGGTADFTRCTGAAQALRTHEAATTIADNRPNDRTALVTAIFTDSSDRDPP